MRKRKNSSARTLLRWLERRIILDVVDTQWKDHLLSLDHLKEGIGLRGYGQKDPLVEFKKEAFILFEDMMTRIDNETVRYLFHVQIQQEAQPAQGQQRQAANRVASHPPAAHSGSGERCGARGGSGSQRLPDFARAMERRQERQQTRFAISDWSGAGGSAEAGARGRESWAQRSLPLRFREEV